MFGETRRSSSKLGANFAGVGFPGSTYRVPPLCRMMLKLLLLPAVWFQGAQSTITGGSSLRHGATWRFIWELLQIMPCVLMTTFGMPVEPEVNRNLAMVS